MCSTQHKCITYWKEPLKRDEEKGDSSPTIRQRDEADNRHSACDKRLDCITGGDVPSMTLRSGQSPIKNTVRTSAGRVNHRLLEFRIDIS